MFGRGWNPASGYFQSIDTREQSAARTRPEEASSGTESTPMTKLRATVRSQFWKLFRSHTGQLEIMWIGSLHFVWAISLLLYAFNDSVGGNEIYAPFFKLTSPVYWAVVSSTLGAATFLGWFLNATIVRWATSCLSAGYFAVTCALMYAGNGGITSVLFYSWSSLICVYIAFRVSSEGRR